MNNKTKTTCRKAKILGETRVIIEPVHIPYLDNMTAESRREFLEKWSHGLATYFEDNSHLDIQSVRAETSYKDICSECGEEWKERLFVDDLEEGEDSFFGCSECGTPMEIVE